MIEPVYQTERVTVFYGDCLIAMQDIDTCDLLLTDPPYGINADELRANRANKKHGKAIAPSRDYGFTEWDKERPDKKSFQILLDAAIHRIIWGGNYFADALPPNPMWLVWDKETGQNGYADCELAWTSLPGAIRKFTWQQKGFLSPIKEKRIHPTQKPVALMRWCIAASRIKENSRIIDPFAGSGTTGVAAIREGMRCILIEREAKYIDIIIRRLEIEEAQGRLF